MGRAVAPAVSVFLAGDVMTGRGIDQLLPHPGDPRLQERHVVDARTYLSLAGQRYGPIPRPVEPTWPWGAALASLASVAPDVRVINLETSITESDDAAAGKAVHYRMAPANIECLAAVRPDVCALANNHVLDYGQRGLADTLATLAAAGLPSAGAGRDEEQAARPAAVPVGAGRVLVFSCGTGSSGIPASWAATGDRPGVFRLPDLSRPTADALIARVRRAKQPGDIVLVSIHWGSNWGYEVPTTQVEFAHWLIDGGVDLLHGHSSHHPRPIEIYRDRLILYGAGDCLDDYEGISGYEEFRDDLRLLYFASLEPGSGRLHRLELAPMQTRRLRLEHAGSADTRVLRDLLDELSRPYRCRFTLADRARLPKPTLIAHPTPAPSRRS